MPEKNGCMPNCTREQGAGGGRRKSGSGDGASSLGCALAVLWLTQFYDQVAGWHVRSGLLHFFQLIKALHENIVIANLVEPLLGVGVSDLVWPPNELRCNKFLSMRVFHLIAADIQRLVHNLVLGCILLCSLGGGEFRANCQKSR